MLILNHNISFSFPDGTALEKSRSHNFPVRVAGLFSFCLSVWLLPDELGGETC